MTPRRYTHDGRLSSEGGCRETGQLFHPLCTPERQRRWLTHCVLFATFTEATIVTDWNDAALAEVRAGRLGPPIVARALAIAHTCMYDAWAAYDQYAVGTTDLGGTRRRPPGERNDVNKAEAISFAAYRCLVNLFADRILFPATGADAAARLVAVMHSHLYDPANVSTDITTPAGIGNVAAQAVIDARSGDGSNQYGDLHPGAYSDYTGYTPSNAPMAYCTPLMSVCEPLDIDAQKRWQPLIGPPPRGVVGRRRRLSPRTGKRSRPSR